MITPPRGRRCKENAVDFSPNLILSFRTAHTSTRVSVNTKKSTFLFTKLRRVASLGPRPLSDSNLIPPTFCVAMVMVFALDAVIVVDVERPGGCVFLEGMLYEGGCLVNSARADVRRKYR
jgi:hypothetical protein